jgi:hypothetical protein
MLFNKIKFTAMRELDLDYLKDCGNLYEKLTDPEHPIYLLRVYGYESMAVDLLYENSSYPNDEEEKFISILKDIRKSLPEGWNDNKIVIELSLGTWDWHFFVGFWDSRIYIGQGVCPNRYAPKAKYINTMVDRIKIR